MCVRVVSAYCVQADDISALFLAMTYKSAIGCRPDERDLLASAISLVIMRRVEVLCLEGLETEKLQWRLR